MNNNVIYTIKADPHWPAYAIDKWSGLTLERMRLYAKRVGADLVVIDESKLKEIKLPKKLGAFQQVNMLKFYALDSFSRSKYERMLFLDLDILIKKEAENIFNVVSCDGIHMTVNKNESDDRTYKELIQNYYFKDKEVPTRVFNSPVYNGGVIYANRASVIRFCEKIPELEGWVEFFESHGLASNPPFHGAWMNEQHLISMFLSLHNFHVSLLDEFKWNIGSDYERPYSNFVHYFGPAKDLLIDKSA